MKEKGWEKEGHSPQQVITLQNLEDEVIAQVDPNCGEGWKITGEGRQKVSCQQNRLALYEFGLSFCLVKFTLVYFCSCI